MASVVRRRRWETFADAVAAALGVNLWVALVLLPALYEGALHGRGAVIAALPLVVLAVGVYRRSDAILLYAYPSALLVPLALSPGAAQAHVYGPWRFALVAIGLIGYLFGASVFTSFREPPPPTSDRALASTGRPVPARWRRRFRVYTGLAILSAVFPAVLFYVVHFDAGVASFLRERFAGRVAAMTTALDLGIVLGWLILYKYVFLGALAAHRTGDRELEAVLARLGERGRRQRPGLAFYLGVVAAIGLMVLLFLLRGPA